MLPKSSGNFQRFKSLETKISEMGGESSLAELRYLEKKDEEKSVAEFRSQSHKEYKKIMSELQRLKTDLDKNPLSSEGESEKMRRLGKKLADAQTRDYFKQRQEPEVSSGFAELLRDMTTATTQLKDHIGNLLSEKL